MHVSMTWALDCAESVQQCPGMARQVEATAADNQSSSHCTPWSTKVAVGYTCSEPGLQ